MLLYKTHTELLVFRNHVTCL